MFMVHVSQVQSHGRPHASARARRRWARVGGLRKVRRNCRQSTARSNLGLGRSSRGSLGDTREVGLVARKNDARKREGNNQADLRYALKRHGHAERHQGAILGAIGKRRVDRATRHIFRHSCGISIGCRAFAGGLIHVRSHSHHGPRDRTQHKSNDGEKREKAAYGGSELHDQGHITRRDEGPSAGYETSDYSACRPLSALIAAAPTPIKAQFGLEGAYLDSTDSISIVVLAR
jgi:hypothetical protein